MWLLVALMGFSVREDLFGVTSIVRALGLAPMFYDRLLDFFHTSALPISSLTATWLKVVLNSGVTPVLSNGRLTIVIDGIKVAKEGRKMPGVKKLHQESESNTKPEFIMGHSLQAASLLVQGVGTVFALPLIARLHEGVKFTNRDKRTLLDKAIEMVDSLNFEKPVTVVADAYYAAGKVAIALCERGFHLITRVRSNAVAWTPAPKPDIPKRGRPKVYGDKVKLNSLFDDENTFDTIESPYAGETGVSVLIRSVDLLWRPARMLVRFVAVIHPKRGRIIIMTTDLTMLPVEVAQIYANRFKIELAFKQALHVIGAYLYHFWMMPMTKIGRNSGTQYLHRKPAEYREAVQRKIDAYHRYIQIGLIAQGIMQILACRFPTLIWQSFGSWLRTMNKEFSPSELVVSKALRNGLIDFLGDSSYGAKFKKFLRKKIDPGRSEGLRLAG